MKKFTLINKERRMIKVFEAFEDVSKPSLCINAMMIPMDVFIREVVNQL